jgi:hypothetical protein
MTLGHNRLAALAGEIAEHHAAAGAATREVIRHAIVAGRALAEAKAIVGHGQWLPGSRRTCPGSAPARRSATLPLPTMPAKTTPCRISGKRSGLTESWLRSSLSSAD